MTKIIDTEKAFERKSDFYRAFGEFVLDFANTEKEVLEILFIVSNVTGWVAKSIFSGVHLDTAKDFINRIIAASNGSLCATGPHHKSTKRHTASWIRVLGRR